MTKRRSYSQRRALIRAEQRYSRLQREYRGVSRLRRNYPNRWRR
jgi:hypothetical protein